MSACKLYHCKGNSFYTTSLNIFLHGNFQNTKFIHVIGGDSGYQLRLWPQHSQADILISQMFVHEDIFRRSQIQIFNMLTGFLDVIYNKQAFRFRMHILLFLIFFKMCYKNYYFHKCFYEFIHSFLLCYFFSFILLYFIWGGRVGVSLPVGPGES